LDWALIEGIDTDTFVIGNYILDSEGVSRVPPEIVGMPIDRKIIAVMGSGTVSGTVLGMPSWVALPGRAKPLRMYAAKLEKPAGMLSAAVIWSSTDHFSPQWMETVDLGSLSRKALVFVATSLRGYQDLIWSMQSRP
jgi:hypothetical protein